MSELVASFPPSLTPNEQGATLPLCSTLNGGDGAYSRMACCVLSAVQATRPCTKALCLLAACPHVCC